MKKMVLNRQTKALVLLLLLAVILTSPLAAWQFYCGENAAELVADTVLLEPDNWSRDALQAMRNNHRVTLAWLNLAQIEDWRLVPAGLKEKDFVLSRRYNPENLKMAVFYSTAYRSLVKGRLREYLLKGFDGVVLAKTGYYKEFSNGAMNHLEMWRLIEELAIEARAIRSTAQVFVHDGESFHTEISKSQHIDGIVVEGLFYGYQGRQIHSWDRLPRLQELQKLQSTGKKILTAEDARTVSRQSFVDAECRRLNIKAAITELPLKIERQKTHASKK